MKKEVIVLSLGGSLIIPSDSDQIDMDYLKKFKKILLKNSKKYKFIVVTGGGSTARKYINALKDENNSQKYQSLIGISITRLHARFLNYFFNEEPELGIPHTIETVEKYLKKQDIVFCGGLEYKPNQTSDATSSQIANHFNSIFINLTDVKGLYDKNPKKFKDAKFITKISWEEFLKRANEIKYSPGQHFVLDQTAAEIIKKHKIKTCIIGKDLNQLDRLLNKKNFTGTTIYG
jgi:uridylate kinase